MTCKEIALLLCAAQGPSGAEAPVAQAATALLAPYGETTTDALGSVCCRVRPAGVGKRHYLLDAHLDEIGLIVTAITAEGFLRVSNVGGVDRRMLSAADVLVHGVRPLPGVVCSTPPHLQGDGERKNPKLDEILIDIGLDEAGARHAVQPGDFITFCGPVRELSGGLISSRALDNRAGCAVVIRAAQLLHEKNVSCGITIALTVQEETGGAGAKTAGWPFSPTHAIVVDVTFGRSPGVEDHEAFVLGGGPTILTAPIVNMQLTRALQRTAQAHGIPFQREVSGGHTDTNADAIAVLGAGVATALISVPQRYMHTPAELLDPNDMEHAARLIAELIAESEDHDG